MCRRRNSVNSPTPEGSVCIRQLGTAMSLTFAKRLFMRLQCRGPHSFIHKGSGLFPWTCLLLPRHRTPDSIDIGFTPGSKEACSVGWTKPQCLSPTQMSRALIFLSGNSDVKLLLLGKHHQQGTCGKGLVKIWEWLDMETSAHVYRW